MEFYISLFMMSDLDKLVGCRVSPYMSNLHIWAVSESLKGVVHPQNDFFSIDYSPHGDLSPIIFFCFCRIPKTIIDFGWVTKCFWVPIRNEWAHSFWMGTRKYINPGGNLLLWFFCLRNATNTKKYDWTQVSMGWVINRKKVILGVNYSFNTVSASY